MTSRSVPQQTAQIFSALRFWQIGQDTASLKEKIALQQNTLRSVKKQNASCVKGMARFIPQLPGVWFLRGAENDDGSRSYHSDFALEFASGQAVRAKRSLAADLQNGVIVFGEI